VVRRTLNKFLRWELEQFPPVGVLWSAETFLPRLERMLDGDLGEQQACTAMSRSLLVSTATER